MIISNSAKSLKTYKGSKMQNNTLNALNTKLTANDNKIIALRDNNHLLISEAITLVNDKIDQLVTDYNISDRKAIKVINEGMFTFKEGVKLEINNKLKQAIKAVLIAHKRKVYDSILWGDLSVSKILEVLKYLTVAEIKEAETKEDIKELLDAKKVKIKKEVLSYKKEGKK